MQDFNFFRSITFILMVLNVVTSLVGLYIYRPLIEQGYLKPYRTVREHTWYELITSGFLHIDFTHLFVNMFTLYFFGPIIEQAIGRSFFLGLYLSGLIVSGLPSLIKFRDNPNFATLGASGAIGAVLFAFIFLFPLESIYIFLIPFPIPAFVFAFAYLIYSMYESKKEQGKINHEAHIAGALWGILYLVLFVPKSIDHIMKVLGWG